MSRKQFASTILIAWAFLALATSCASMKSKSVPDAETYYDKVYGAWLGKCIGGALGMPIEGWNHERILATYGTINDYIGYFDEITMATTDPVAQVKLTPKPDTWQSVTINATVPEYDTQKYHACPAIGIGSGKDTGSDYKLELRNLSVEGAAQLPALNSKNWLGYFVGVGDDGVATFDYKSYFTSQYLKLTPSQTKNCRLQPGTKLVVKFEARVGAGIERAMVAFDHVLTGPRPGFGPDDDTTYQIVSLLALEKYGPDLSARQIGQQWIDSLGFVSPLLAEGLALKNLREGIMPPKSGIHKMDEAIGGQIKAEVWGLVCPGHPELAAEYARRDGVVAHANNGVYGEQFVAAMMAAAFTEKRPEKLIEIGLKQIPADSLYARTVRWTIQMHKQYADYHEPLKKLVAKYPMPCDPLFGDAGIITLALLYGNGEFEKTMLIAAQCGQDTDCDTATVAALMGCVHGAAAIPTRWKAPIADEFRCFVKDHETWSIKELSRRFCAAGEKVTRHHGERGLLFTSEL
jgi:ADP-ribosylglycohydrolase